MSLKNLLLFISATFIAAHSYAQSLIDGRLTDNYGDLLPAQQVFLYQGDSIIAQTTTNYYGRYKFRKIIPGNYVLKINGHIPNQHIQITRNITVSKKNHSQVNFEVQNRARITKRVYRMNINRPPLIDPKKPGGRSTSTSGYPDRLPTVESTITIITCSAEI